MTENFVPPFSSIHETLPGSIPTNDMTQKVAKEGKMKSQQEKTSLCQIETVTAKPRIIDKERWFG